MFPRYRRPEGQTELPAIGAWIGRFVLIVFSERRTGCHHGGDLQPGFVRHELSRGDRLSPDERIDELEIGIGEARRAHSGNWAADGVQIAVHPHMRNCGGHVGGTPEQVEVVAVGKDRRLDVQIKTRENHAVDIHSRLQILILGIHGLRSRRGSPESARAMLNPESLVIILPFHFSLEVP